MSEVWIVDDDANLLKVVSAALRLGGHVPQTFDDAESALKSLETLQTRIAGTEHPVHPEAIITDLQMSAPPGGSGEMNGIDFLRRMKISAPEIPVILLTAHGTVDSAVEAMKAGAYDFLTKPVDHEKLLVTVRNAIAFGALSAEVQRLRETRRKDLGATLVGNSQALRHVLDLIARVAGEMTTVLISGETGTGKEVAARAIHAASPRAAGPFVPVNCAAIPGELIESELFGHLKGAFTSADRDRKGWFQAADGGTLFLDEVGELPPSAQSKLLRALQDKEVTPIGARAPIKVDVRIIAATNRDLSALVQSGRFREDLIYRLNVFPITIPPLRERKEDLPILVAHLLARRTDDPPEVAPGALQALYDHEWRGNVRELDNILERALVLSEEKTINREHLAFPECRDTERAVQRVAPVQIEIPASGLELEQLEKTLIEQALGKTGGNQTMAARLLGITRSALIYRIEKYQIKP